MLLVMAHGLSGSDIGSIAATTVAAVIGITTFVTNKKVRAKQEKFDKQAQDHQEQLEKTTEKAELNRAEVAAWKTLIDTLMKQYTESSREAGELRGRLGEGNKRFEIIAQELSDARERIAVQEERIAVQEERIQVLRDEVERLGGDVEEINRVGKRGQPGEKGPPGDKGETG